MVLPKIDIVTQEQAKKDFLLIGIQLGFFGFILRFGLYRQWI